MTAQNDERLLSLQAAQVIVGAGLVLAVAVLCLVIALSVLVLAREPASTPHTMTWYARHLTQTGIASWYGPRFHGRKTASGEVFDQNKMTAAHPSLRFGTIVVVTKAANRRAVKVRINDRGPFIRGRIIDLSRAAAAQLGMKKSGLARVTVTHP